MKWSPFEKAGDGIFDPAIYKPLIGRAAFEERVNKGRLPIIMICDQLFFVDVRLGLLRPKNNFLVEGLNIRDGGFYDHDTGTRSFYYHIPSRSEVFISRFLTEYPADTVLIQVPDNFRLDPVGMARLEGKPDDYFIDFPVRMYHVAKVILLEKTEVAEWIQENRTCLPAEEQRRLRELDKARKAPRKKVKGKRLK